MPADPPRPSDDMVYKGRWIAITGASSGIGEAFAREFASRGANLVLVARRRERLERLSDELRRGGCGIRTLVQDLGEMGAAEKVHAEIRALRLPIFGLINNAGFGAYGPSGTSLLERNQKQVMVNIYALTSLSCLMVSDMAEAGEGFIMNISSMAAFLPYPYLATYSASKAYILSFTQALSGEAGNSGVRVLAVCPGATDTEFFEASDPSNELVKRAGELDPPGKVVREALAGLEKGASLVIVGARNRLMARILNVLPRGLLLRFATRKLAPNAPARGPGPRSGKAPGFPLRPAEPEPPKALP